MTACYDMDIIISRLHCMAISLYELVLLNQIQGSFNEQLWVLVFRTGVLGEEIARVQPDTAPVNRFTSFSRHCGIHHGCTT